MSKLFKKTLIVVVLLFGLISGSISLISAWSLHQAMTAEFEVKGQSLARIIADASVTPLLNDQAATLQSMIDEYLGIVGVSHIVIASQEGEVMVHTFAPGIPPEISTLVNQLTGHSKAVHYTATRDTTQSQAVDDHSYQNMISPILGGVAGYVLVGMDTELIRQQIIATILRQQIIILVLLVIAIAASYWLINRISRPLTRLSAHAEKLAVTPLDQLHQLQHEISPLAAKHHDEIGALARSFIYMEQTLDESIKKLAENVATQERINTELAVAKEIQRKMLPSSGYLAKIDKQVAVEAMMRSAKEVGGDLYDCFFLEDRNAKGERGNVRKKLFFIIGDVSGKGVPAALFMSITSKLFRSAAHGSSLPNELVETVNAELSTNNDACMFVTIFCGVLDLDTGELIYCSAGHNPPMVISSRSGVTPLKAPPGIAVGAMEAVQYQNGSYRLGVGETLFMYTDGVTEARNVRSMLYTEQRLIEMLGRQPDFEPGRVLQETIKDIDLFAEGAEQADDIAMLAIRRIS